VQDRFDSIADIVQFGSEMSLKGSGVEGLVPSVAVFRGGVFEK
jgi:hypothetical protein